MQKMKIHRTFNLLQAIEEEPSSNLKTLLIQEFSDEGKRILKISLDTMVKFGIGDKSLDDFNPEGTGMIPGSFSYIIKYLEFNNTGSGEAVEMVNEFLSTCTEFEYKWCRRIILKDLKIGVSKKTVNKVLPNLIPSFDVMLAHSYKDHTKKVEGKEFILQKKIDGVRLLAIARPTGTIFLTRKGHEVDGLDHIAEELSKFGTGFVYDGEVEGENFTDTKVTKQGPKPNLTFRIFDVIPLSEFDSGIFTEKYFDRVNNIPNFVPGAACERVEVLYKGTDAGIIDSMLADAVAKGWEGLMLKIDAPYRLGKCTNILKLKRKCDLDLEVVEIFEGTKDSKFEGIMGAVGVRYKGNIVSVGGGFSDVERKLYWKVPRSIIGKIVCIEFDSESQDSKTGKFSLRFPQFKGIREDKDSPDY